MGVRRRRGWLRLLLHYAESPMRTRGGCGLQLASLPHIASSFGGREGGIFAFVSYFSLRDVTQESHRWQVRVRVTRFSQFTTANEPDKILRLDLVLLDEQGDMMDAQIPGRHVSQFKPLLKEDAVYYIKYFEVAEARP
uniref:Replication protein A 70 kDa DNA-binding subunit B/D first OB fold domain-containing protein n=1 Tax=Oryza rufipogon TaxID=4529 RepID=A0A0E0RIC3_ORYRU